MTVRDHLRAAAIAVALVLFGLQALPLPPAVTERTLARPQWRLELDRWHPLLRSAGLVGSRDELEDAIVAVTAATSSFRHAATAPLVPFARVTGTGQQWGLFSAASRTTWRLVVEVRRADDAFRPIHRSLDPDHRWREAQLGYRRVRAVYDGSGGRGRDWERFVAWVAALAFADDPSITHVRVAQEARVTRRPDEPADPADGRRRGARTVARDPR